MAVIDTTSAIARFGVNESNINQFVNGVGTYTTNDPVSPQTVQTIPSFIATNQANINSTVFNLATLNIRGSWAASTYYAIKDLVYVTVSGLNTYYVCVTAHTSSSSFTGDTGWVVYAPALGNYANTIQIFTPTYTLIPSQAGSVIQVGSATAGQVITLPANGSTIQGGTFAFYNNSNNATVVQVQSTGFIYDAPNLSIGNTSITLNSGDTAVIVSRGNTEWDLVDGTLSMLNSAAFQSSIGVFAKGSPTGLGTSTLTTAQSGMFFEVGAGATITLPSPASSALTYNLWAQGGFTLVGINIYLGNSGSSSVVIPPGCPITVINDGGNWIVVGYSGMSSNPTVLDNSTKNATTAFVKNAGESFSTVVALGTSTTLGTVNLGQALCVNGSGTTQTLPPVATCPAGSCFSFNALYSCTIKANGSENISYGTSLGNTASLNAGENLQIVSNGSSWYCLNYDRIEAGIGVGQTWTNVTSSRSASTTYYNTTTQPILVLLEASLIISTTWAVSVSSMPSVNWVTAGPTTGVSNTLTFIVPPSGGYSTTGFTNWFELR